MIRSNRDARLSIQQRDEPSPTQFITQTHDRGRSEKCRHRYHHNPGAHVFPAASPVGGVGGVLSKQASLQIGPERLESGRVSLEIGQSRSFEDMDAFDVERQFLGDLLTMTGDRLAARTPAGTHSR